MTTTAVLTLPRPQWCLLNMLHRRAMFTARRSALPILQRAEATCGDLIDLELRRVIVVTVDGNDVDLVEQFTGVWSSEKQMTTFLALRDVKLRLSEAGFRWVLENPHNRALHSMAEIKLASGWPLVNIAAAAGVDIETLVDLCNDGLITIVDEADSYHTGKHLKPSRVNRFWRAKLTLAGRRIVDGGT